MLIGRRFIGWFGSWLALALTIATITGSVNWIGYYRLVQRFHYAQAFTAS
jgi:hypothetical protein